MKSTLRKLLVAIIVWATGVLSWGQSSSGVLILSSYHPGYGWSDGELRGLLDTLLEASPDQLPSIEYLDWKRHPTGEQEEAFVELLRVRYDAMPLRVVVTLDDKAFELALQNRHLFGSAPIVFGGVNHFVPEAYGDALTNVTGVAETKDFERTLDLIQRLQPHVREVVGYHDASESSFANRRALEIALAKFSPDLSCRFIENWTVDELCDRLSRLPADAVAFSLGASRDRNGKLLADDQDFLERVSEACSVPIYIISEPIVPLFSTEGLNDAVWDGVGGSLVSGTLHGEQVGELALRVLNGESADEIPPVTNSAGYLAVDWTQMKRFDLPISALPEGTAIYNQPENFYRVHKVSIQVGLVTLIGLSIVTVVLMVNIVLRRRAEHKSIQLGAALEQAGEIVIMLNPDGEVTFINPAFSLITGWPVKAGRATTLACLSSSEDEDAFARTIRRLRKEHGCSVHVKCRHKNGSPLLLLMMGSVVKDAAGRLTGYVLIARDITREADLEEQVRRAQKMEAVGLLAGGVAHDFNNLLQVIMGHAQLALDPSATDAERAESLDVILSTATRGAQLPRQLLAFGRRQPLNMEDVNLNQFVEQMLGVLGRLIGEHIEVRFLPEVDEAMVHADSHQLEQVMMNLSVNARDAMSDSGTLTFRLKRVELTASFCETHAWARPGRFVCLSVEDTGCGIDSDSLERIFEPFYTTKPVDKGTGLGLSVVYGIIEQHNGLIHIGSTLGEGTTFGLYLPESVSAHDRPAAAPPAVVPARPAGQETILLVEDDVSVRGLSRRVLQHVGYQVMEAVNGEDAVAMFAEHADDIDLVIMDMVMPKMSGPTAGKKMAAIRPGVPLLYCSGYSKDLVDEQFDARHLDVLQKPYEVATFLDRVSTMLSGRNG